MENFGAYAFQQTPSCGFTETLTLENYPPEPFVTHNVDTQDFTVAETSTTDPADTQYVGVYEVVITSTFDQLNLDKTVTQVTQTINF